ncbi:MAG: hypothetical protein GAK34_02779 [Delftia tsuruhatensis]|nr:MAG: hypothetical protein GAK34_02779 [Delftia tsuruhatensis]
MSASVNLAKAVYGNAGYNWRPSWWMPCRMARSKAANDQRPMPVSWSGVILVEYTVPKGVSSAKPPALGAPPGAVWQTTQSPAAATSRPRAMACGEYSDTSGPAVSGNAGLAGHAMTVRPASPAAAAVAQPQLRRHSLPTGAGSRPASARRSCSDRNGAWRKRTPVASWMALAMAAAAGSVITPSSARRPCVNGPAALASRPVTSVRAPRAVSARVADAAGSDADTAVAPQSSKAAGTASSRRASSRHCGA